MRVGSSSILGLAFSDEGILCAEVSFGGEKRQVRRLAAFAGAVGDASVEPEAVGGLLRRFLREQGLRARRAAVGLPARWTVATEQALPPLNPDAAIAALRLQGERLAATHGQDLVFDAAIPAQGSDGGHILLVGAARARLDRVVRICAAAGIKPALVTPTAAAVTCCLGGQPSRSGLLLTKQGVELVSANRHALTALRHLPASAASGCDADSLAVTVRRALAMQPLPDAGTARWFLWQGIGMDAPTLARLESSLGVSVERLTHPRELGAAVASDALNGTASHTDVTRFLPAVAVALATRASQDIAIDLLHSRLRPRTSWQVRRRPALVIAAGAAVVIGLTGLYWYTRGLERDAMELAERAAALRPDVQAAEDAIRQVTFGRRYFTARPPTLSCLARLAEAFGTDASLWATQVTVREGARAQISGKAVDQRAVLGLMERLKRDPNLDEVQLLDLREGGGETRSVTFSVSFAYREAH